MHGLPLLMQTLCWTSGSTAHITYVLQHCRKLHQITVDGNGKLSRGDTAVMTDINIAETNSRCHPRLRNRAELELRLTR